MASLIEFETFSVSAILYDVDNFLVKFEPNLSNRTTSRIYVSTNPQINLQPQNRRNVHYPLYHIMSLKFILWNVPVNHQSRPRLATISDHKKASLECKQFMEDWENRGKDASWIARLLTRALSITNLTSCSQWEQLNEFKYEYKWTETECFGFDPIHQSKGASIHRTLRRVEI